MTTMPSTPSHPRLQEPKKNGFRLAMRTLCSNFDFRLADEGQRDTPTLIKQTLDSQLMYDNYTELTIEGITRGKELQDAFILILRKKDGEEVFPVLLDERGYQMIFNALRNKDFTCSHLMNQLAGRVGMTMIGIRLMQPANGKTQALIDFELINEVASITVPVAEAVVAALEAHCAIWVGKDVFLRASRAQQGKDVQQMALPITAMSDKLIEEALKNAVDEENFELASFLHNELNRRKNFNSDSPVVL